MPLSRVQAKITREYERKGYGLKRARRIARATVYHDIDPAMKRKKAARGKRSRRQHRDKNGKFR